MAPLTIILLIHVIIAKGVSNFFQCDISGTRACADGNKLVPAPSHLTMKESRPIEQSVSCLFRFATSATTKLPFERRVTVARCPGYIDRKPDKNGNRISTLSSLSRSRPPPFVTLVVSTLRTRFIFGARAKYLTGSATLESNFVNPGCMRPRLPLFNDITVIMIINNNNGR